MRVLHISSYYITNKLYMNLFKKLSHKGIKQEVFIPIKDSKFIGKNQLPAEFNTVKYHYKNILKKYDKILYHHKINKQLKEIEKANIMNKNVEFIHAHTVFSDGGTAYKLLQKYGVNYIVSVRNTDINSFYKYGIHLRPFMHKVLLNARKIIFISHAYKEKLFSLLPTYILTQIQEKCEVIPNGIEDYWHEHAKTKKEFKKTDEVNLLFIGLVDQNKNVKTVISACKELKKQGIKATLNIVGSGPLEEECKQLSTKLGIDKEVEFHGYITDKKAISVIMDKSDIFVMPSFKETFGLVYIEAMSRGIPVIYSYGQGIDGFYRDGEVGFSVDPASTDAIVKSIKQIMKDYNEISNRCIDHSKSFHWDYISERYLDIYKS